MLSPMDLGWEVWVISPLRMCWTCSFPFLEKKKSSPSLLSQNLIRYSGRSRPMDSTQPNLLVMCNSDRVSLNFSLRRFGTWKLRWKSNSSSGLSSRTVFGQRIDWEEGTGSTMMFAKETWFLAAAVLRLLLRRPDCRFNQWLVVIDQTPEEKMGISGWMLSGSLHHLKHMAPEKWEDL